MTGNFRVMKSGESVKDTWFIAHQFSRYFVTICLIAGCMHNLTILSSYKPCMSWLLELVISLLYSHFWRMLIKVAYSDESVQSIFSTFKKPNDNPCCAKYLSSKKDTANETWTITRGILKMVLVGYLMWLSPSSDSVIWYFHCVHFTTSQDHMVSVYVCMCVCEHDVVSNSDETFAIRTSSSELRSNTNFQIPLTNHCFLDRVRHSG